MLDAGKFETVTLRRLQGIFAQGRDEPDGVPDKGLMFFEMTL
jgi:hypothetical protein